MIKVYKMPNGKLYRFNEGEAPAGAVPVEKAVKAENKAKKTSNKAAKAEEK